MMPKMPHVTWEFILHEAEDVKKLSDPEFIENFVKEFCKEFELTLVNPKLLHQFHGEKPDENGITAFYILAESGIHIQTWPEYKYGFVDVFSCKHFNEKEATIFIRNEFGKGHYHYDIVWRGGILNEKVDKSILLDTKPMEKDLKEKEKSIAVEKRVKISRFKLKE